MPPQKTEKKRKKHFLLLGNKRTPQLWLDVLALPTGWHCPPGESLGHLIDWFSLVNSPLLCLLPWSPLLSSSWCLFTFYCPSLNAHRSRILRFGERNLFVSLPWHLSESSLPLQFANFLIQSPAQIRGAPQTQKPRLVWSLDFRFSAHPDFRLPDICK